MQHAEHVLLSTRQAEIAQLLLAGKTTREIAFALTLSARTVETHIAAIYNKYGVGSRSELIIAIMSSEPQRGPSADAFDITKTNLPARRAALLGRVTDVANITNALHESRLVTLTGSGGIGKTRTAIAVGEAILADYEHGVWIVELASLAHGSSVGDALARTLNIKTAPNLPTIDTLISRLKQKSILVILDNCEHLIHEAASIADALLLGCPHLRILSTSREPLRIAGERTFRLPSLRVPSPEQSRSLDAAGGAAYASIELFAHRAQAVDYAFTLTNENTPYVAEICRRVDGIPLAIELAAARINILPVHALATKLDSHLRILGGADRVAPPRHQTMRALIDWSYDLLDFAEQRLFERLAVCVGGCSLAQAVAVYDDATVDEVGMLDMLASLIDKSLVVVETAAPEPRYGLLQTFAQYGWEKLALRGDATTAAQRHAVTYVELAERLEAEYDSAPSTSWFARAQCEIENWRAALDWTLEARHDVVLGQRLVAALRPVWVDAEGGQRWLQTARELIDERTPAMVAASVHFATAFINFEFGELEQTITDCHALAEVYENLGDSLRAAYLRTWEGTAMVLLGRATEAEPLLASSLSVARLHARQPFIAYVLGVLAQVRFATGESAEGRARAAESIAIFESIGAELRAAVARANLAEAEFSCGNIGEAVQLGTNSLIAIRRVGAKTNVAMGLINLAGYCIAAGQWKIAHAHAHEAVEIMKDTQHHVFFPVALQHVAAVAALDRSATDGLTQAARAAQLLGYTDACFTRLGYLREINEQREYDRVLAALREEFAPNELTEQLANGAAMKADAAVALVRSLGH